jgi:hypothetical protein
MHTDKYQLLIFIYMYSIIKLKIMKFSLIFKHLFTNRKQTTDTFYPNYLYLGFIKYSSHTFKTGT